MLQFFNFQQWMPSFVAFDHCLTQLFFRFASAIQEDVQRCVKELEDEGSITSTAVELISNDLSSVYAASKRAQVSGVFILRCITSLKPGILIWRSGKRGRYRYGRSGV